MPLVALVYGGLSAVSVGIAFVGDRNPIETTPWLALPCTVRHVLSVAGGVLLGVATTRATRHFVKRWAWARALHADLRPVVRDASDRTLWLLGLSSAVAEELFFRSVLATALGLVASSVAFGLLHQVRGRARWAWAAWATIMGLLFGALFLSTGSLLGAIVAHAGINVSNLRFLRDTDVDPPPPRRLGGLLARG